MRAAAVCTAVAMAFAMLTAPAYAADQSGLRIEWMNGLLTIFAPQVPGGVIETNYLEAFCRKGSTNRKWEETVVPHTMRSTSQSADRTHIELESEVTGGVNVSHEIRANEDCVTFDLTLTNTSGSAVDIEWAQPCMRVGAFTGKGQEDYVPKCFIFTAQGATMLDKTNRTVEAIYKGGQVYVPRGINRADVNPRPLSPDVPVNNLIGCISSDNKWIVATAWDQTQELFQGIITCIHADFRIGGLAPGETKRLHGVVYVVPNDLDALQKRYEQDFPKR